MGYSTFGPFSKINIFRAHLLLWPGHETINVCDKIFGNVLHIKKVIFEKRIY